LLEPGPDNLKHQYSEAEGACSLLDEACEPEVPWLILGGGADPGVLEEQTEVACRAGASGFIVGRPLFDPTLIEDEEAGTAALQEVSLPILEVSGCGRGVREPWRDRVGKIEMPRVDGGGSNSATSWVTRSVR
jgi:hypothetical protein